MSQSNKSSKRSISASVQKRLNRVANLHESKLNVTIDTPQPSQLQSKPVQQSDYILEDSASNIRIPTEDSLPYRPQKSNKTKTPAVIGIKSLLREQAGKNDSRYTHNITDQMIKGNSFPLEYDEVIEEGILGMSNDFGTMGFLRSYNERMARLEKRLETNEGLVHLYDEMQELNQLETRNVASQKENVKQEIRMRTTGLENKLELFTENLKLQKGSIDNRLESFTEKIESYLGRFIETTNQLGQKFDGLALSKEKERNSSMEKIANLDKKLDNVAEEISHRINTLHEAIEDVGTMTNENTNELENEKYNVRKLEDDFLRLLNASKNQNQFHGSIKWLSDEILQLKEKQIAILNHLNYGRVSHTSSNDHGTPV